MENLENKYINHIKSELDKLNRKAYCWGGQKYYRDFREMSEWSIKRTIDEYRDKKNKHHAENNQRQNNLEPAVVEMDRKKFRSIATAPLEFFFAAPTLIRRIHEYNGEGVVYGAFIGLSHVLGARFGSEALFGANPELATVALAAYIGSNAISGLCEGMRYFKKRL